MRVISFFDYNTCNLTAIGSKFELQKPQHPNLIYFWHDAVEAILARLKDSNVEVQKANASTLQKLRHFGRISFLWLHMETNCAMGSDRHSVYDEVIGILQKANHWDIHQLLELAKLGKYF